MRAPSTKTAALKGQGRVAFKQGEAPSRFRIEKKYFHHVCGGSEPESGSLTRHPRFHSPWHWPWLNEEEAKGETRAQVRSRRRKMEEVAVARLWGVKQL